MGEARLDECLRIEAIERMARRIYRDLAEALDRIPYTIASRPLVESALKLVEPLINEVQKLRAIVCSSLEARRSRDGLDR